MNNANNKLSTLPTQEDLEYLICIAGGVFEDLRNPFIYKNPENIRRLLNRKGVSEIVRLSYRFNNTSSCY